MAAIGRSIVLWFVIGAVLATAGWLAVQAWHKPPQEGTVMRVYNVRPDLAIEIEGAVGVAVRPFQASVTPGGQLMVTAPPSYQRGVEQLLREMAAHNPPAPPSIRIEAWFVTASPGQPVDSPALKEIEPALHALEQSKGPMRFELLEALSTTGKSGQKSSYIVGERTNLTATASVLRDTADHPIVSAEIKLAATNIPGPLHPSITAQTQLRPGELLVLGQSGFADKGAERQLYYIVRATL
jgi:hypothetical protein